MGQLTPGAGPVAAEVPGDTELLRTIAPKLTAAGRDAILCAASDDGLAVVIMRATGSGLDCNKLWKQLAAQYGGRGGGRPDRVEGKLSSRMPIGPQRSAPLGLTSR